MKSKITLLIMAILLSSSTILAQAKLGDNPTNVNSNVLLELESSDKGLLIPRLTTAQRDAAFTSNVPNSLLIYNTTDDCLQVYRDNSGSWSCLGGTSGGALTLEGNVLKLNGSSVDLSDLLSLTVGEGDASTSIIQLGTSSITLKEGSNITLTESGNTITIAARSGGSGGGGAVGPPGPVGPAGPVGPPGVGTGTDSQTLTGIVSGTDLQLKLSNVATSTIDLSAFTTSTGTDSQTIAASLSGTVLQLLPQNTTVTETLDLAYFDNTGTDTQTIVASLSGTVLQLLPQNTTVTETLDLVYFDNTGTDTQTIVVSLSGTVLQLLPQNTTVTETLDLAYFDNTGTDTQTIVASLSGTVLQLLPQNTTVTETLDLAYFDNTGTDTQTIAASLSGTVLQLLPQNTTVTETLDLAYFDNTGTDTQTIVASLSGTVLQLLPQNTTVTETLDLAYFDNTGTDTQTIAASLSGTVLQLLPQNTTVTETLDLAYFDNTGTDTQTLSLLAGTTTTTIISLNGAGTTSSTLTLAAGDNITLTENTTTGVISITAVVELAEVTENGKTGYRLTDEPADNHGNIGTKAMDLSIQAGSSPIHGATGDYSTAMGRNTMASGFYSTAMGIENSAQTYGQTTLGLYSQPISGLIPLNTITASHPVFVVGNGTSASNRSNALVILKNGNTELNGALTLNPTGTSSYTLPTTKGTAGQVLTMDNAATGSTAWTTVSGGGSMPTGLVSVTDIAGKSGYRLALEPSANHGAIGQDAVDLSIQTRTSTFTGARGDGSFASGDNTTASGESSTAMGEDTRASGDYSTAMGSDTDATGEYSTAMGNRTTAESYGQTTLGIYSTSQAGNATSRVDTDRLLVVGNGDSSTRSDALVMLKNGNTELNGSLQIDGAASNKTAFDAGGGTTIDFSKSNLAYTSATTSNTFTLTGIKDGGSYTLAVQGSSSGMSVFSAGGFSFKTKNNGVTTGGTDTLYTFIVMGTTVYFSMVTGIL